MAYLNEAFVDEDIEDDDDIKIVRTKKFAVKPMYPEDACIQIDLLGHNFYVFRNAYGLIEPEF